MPPYKPGELDQRIKIFRQVKTDDGEGGFTRVPTLIYTLWAKVKPQGGNEIFKFEKVEGPTIYTFTIRQSESVVILLTDYIEWNGVKHNIRPPLDKNTRHLYRDIKTEREVAQ